MLHAFNSTIYVFNINLNYGKNIRIYMNILRIRSKELLATLQIKILKLCNFFSQFLLENLLFKLRNLNAKTAYLSLIYLF